MKEDARHCHGTSSSTSQATTGAQSPKACPAGSGERGRGLVVAPECECTPYDRDDYPYPQSVEPAIAELLGGAWSPYDGTTFDSLRDSHIEHIVALSEAHESGLCAATASVRARFARDFDNLTLATPSENREKWAHDATRWLPDHNRCWFAGRVVAVRQEYNLTIDASEKAVLEDVLAGCSEDEIERPRPL